MRKFDIKQVDSENARFNRGYSDFRDLVNLWLKHCEPEELKLARRLFQENIELKDLQATPFAETPETVQENADLRFAFRLPESLYRFLEFMEPEMWKNTPKGKKSRASLFRQCPQLSLAQKF